MGELQFVFYFGASFNVLKSVFIFRVQKVRVAVANPSTPPPACRNNCSFLLS